MSICNRFNEWIEDLEKYPKKLHSTKEVVDTLTHCTVCSDCSKAYDDWYYSPKNSNYDRYMANDRQFKQRVEERKKCTS